MTDLQAKLAWIKKPFVRRELKKRFLLNRAKDISVRWEEAVEASDFDRIDELVIFLGAVVEEMSKLDMPEADPYYVILASRPHIREIDLE